MPGLGDEVEVRRGVSWRGLGGGTGSAGVLLVWAWAAMVHGLRGRLEGWRSLECCCWSFRFLEVWAGRRRLRAAVLFRVRDLRWAGSRSPGESPTAALPVETDFWLVDGYAFSSIHSWPFHRCCCSVSALPGQRRGVHPQLARHAC